MFCVLWLVHMIDSPPPASFFIPSALRPCPQRVKGKINRFDLLALLCFLFTCNHYASLRSSSLLPLSHSFSPSLLAHLIVCLYA